jgi:hypothetical protein
LNTLLLLVVVVVLVAMRRVGVVLEVLERVRVLL